MASQDVIPFHNYTDLGFTFKYNNEAYIVAAGETKHWAPFIVFHGAKHLIDRELVRTGNIKLLNDKTEREKLLNKIVSSESQAKVEPQEETPIEVEEEFPDLKKLNPSGFQSKKVDLSRKEMFAKVKKMGLKVKITTSNRELKRLIKENG